MSIVVLQTFKAVEGRYAQLVETIASMIPATAARAGAEFIHAAGDSVAGVVTVYEQWDGPENLGAYVAWRTANTDMSIFAGVLREPPKIEQLARVY